MPKARVSLPASDPRGQVGFLSAVLILAWASGKNRLKPGHPTTSDASARCSVCRLQAARGQNETSPIFKRALRPRTGS